MRKKIDLADKRFGRLVVICENGRAKNHKVMWLCKCDCGAEITVRGDQLRSGHTTSCGCYNRERASECSKTHGMTNTRLFNVWCCMLRRTGVIKGADEKTKRNYIDRGITVCNEWKTFENFRDWSLSHGYSEGFQIDRVNNDASYYPENCRWVSCRENTNNRRCTLRLADGTAFTDFCRSIGIETYNQTTRNTTKQYDKYADWFRKHNGECHPELLKKANDLISLYSKCLKMITLLNDVRKLRETT